MKTILLAGYRPTEEDNAPWLQSENGKAVLENRIQQALKLSPNCVVVLAGRSADHALTACPSLEKCELVFDTHGDEANLLSNLKAATHMGEDFALVLPAELPFGPAEKLKQLIGLAVQHGTLTPYHMIQSESESFPLVLTPIGCKELFKNKELKSLADPELTRHVSCL